MAPRSKNPVKSQSKKRRSGGRLEDAPTSLGKDFMRSMPYHIFEFIMFDCLVGPYHEPARDSRAEEPIFKSPYALQGVRTARAVCKSWNNFIINDHRYWTVICLHTRGSFHIAKRALERAGDEGIHISLSPIQMADRKRVLQNYSSRWNSFEQGFMFIEKYLSRCISLSLSIAVDLPFSSTLPRYLSSEAPLLQILIIKATLSELVDHQTMKDARYPFDHTSFQLFAMLFNDCETPVLSELFIRDALISNSWDGFNGLSYSELEILSVRYSESFAGKYLGRVGTNTLLAIMHTISQATKLQLLDFDINL
ncbi:hypothetical protein SISSUDRAFT_874683 [Sistotremastrum suecicum HHB10207 ss-3]|uniref:F-box domain-containing protein n=1 Tax=Sistotremastrum suecicum HHB10207 ss-3 TaxID=1314776 RepID=A0A166CAD4_9AGAM|nr:hypothetical protein SISSUDRAFT_874683 [Sistotremastrum suecicum HHB10207 ss-3]